MKNLLKFVIFLVCLIPFTKQSTQFLKTKNIFEENVNIKNGDVIQCEVTKADVAKSENPLHVNTIITSLGYSSYSYIKFDNDSKCLSFKVKTKGFAHIAINDSPTYYTKSSRNWLEVVMQYADSPGPNTYSVIRTSPSVEVAHVKTPYILSENELKGFWMRWLDDQTFEVGHESESKPFMSYRNPTKLSVKYFGVASYHSNSEWIFYGDSKCPKANDTKKETRAESECFILN